MKDKKPYEALIEAIDMSRGKHKGTIVAADILKRLQKMGYMQPKANLN